MKDEVAIGELLGGKYRVERLLGEGGMGLVLAVRHVTLDQVFAVKLLPGTADELLRERFLREARASARVQNEHVVDVFDVGSREDGATFMVMELLEGEDLEHMLLRRGPLPVDEAVRYVGQAAEGLSVAHALGVIHRDVKPGNLFVDRGERVKVLDFGVSKEALSVTTAGVGLTQSGSILGTPRYMAPEQLVSSRDVDPRADVWSLGVTLYELLAGRPAFAAENIAEICTAIVRHEPVPIRQIRSDVPADLEAVIQRCLHKDPLDRYPDVDALRNQLRRFVRPPGEAHPQRVQIAVEPATAHSDTVAASLAATMADEGADRAEARQPRASPEPHAQRASPEPHAPRASPTVGWAPDTTLPDEVSPPLAIDAPPARGFPWVATIIALIVVLTVAGAALFFAGWL